MTTTTLMLPETEEKIITTEKVIPVTVVDEMKGSYLDYAMSVIVGRALPNVRDGLKPVHRRILYSMYKLGLFADRPYKKSATIVGDVLGKYHPHGDMAVYDTLVRMAQDFSLRYPVIDGHGNFGSVDGDAAAAYRYTEARLSKISSLLLQDLEKETISFVPNFDNSSVEPVVLPAVLPNLLVNGSSGIAVGMATNIPPHNLGEIINGLVYLVDHPDATVTELMQYIPGPDFPTGAYIVGRDNIKNAYQTGRGSLIIRAKSTTEKLKGNRKAIIVNEIPYQVNKAKLIETIAELVKNKKISGIHDLRDESDRQGMRIVIELKQDVQPQILLNQLYKHTSLQDSFGVNMVALCDGQPKLINLQEALSHFIKHREEIITNRTKYELKKAKQRKHIVEGLILAEKNLDRIIKLIRESESVEKASQSLRKEFGLSSDQTQAILDMRLQRLTRLEQSKLDSENTDLKEQITSLQEILASRTNILTVLKKELLQAKKEFGDTRRTIIQDEEVNLEVTDLIPDEEVAITITNSGYIKRMPASTYRNQKRGGKGSIGSSTKVNDFVKHLFITNTHCDLLFFTNLGKFYRLKVYQIEEAQSRYSRGTALINLLEITKNEKITAVIPIKEFREDYLLLMATRKGILKKTPLVSYDVNRRGGIIALTLLPDDELISVELTSNEKDKSDEIILGTKEGYCIRFPASSMRTLSRIAQGVIGVHLRKGDTLVGMSVIKNKDNDLMVITNKGFAKRSPLPLYRIQQRAGKGIKLLNLTDKTGKVVDLAEIEEGDELMISTKEGIIIRVSAHEINAIGRNTQGVKVIKLDPDDEVSAFARITSQGEEQIIWKMNE